MKLMGKGDIFHSTTERNELLNGKTISQEIVHEEQMPRRAVLRRLG